MYCAYTIESRRPVHSTTGMSQEPVQFLGSQGRTGYWILTVHILGRNINRSLRLQSSSVLCGSVVSTCYTGVANGLQWTNAQKMQSTCTSSAALPAICAIPTHKAPRRHRRHKTQCACQKQPPFVMHWCMAYYCHRQLACCFPLPPCMAVGLYRIWILSFR